MRLALAIAATSAPASSSEQFTSALICLASHAITTPAHLLHTSYSIPPRVVIMSNKPVIPSWQRASANAQSATPPKRETSSEEPQETSPASGPEQSTGDGRQEQNTESASLLEQASRFLEDPAIHDAPRERKVTFLQSKGVRSEEIEELLGNPVAEDASPDITEAGERAWSTVSILSVLVHEAITC